MSVVFKSTVTVPTPGGPGFPEPEEEITAYYGGIIDHGGHWFTGRQSAKEYPDEATGRVELLRTLFEYQRFVATAVAEEVVESNPQTTPCVDAGSTAGE